jgi:stringent starvation protein B
MTSNRPYLLRALYDWISDNGFNPHLLVDANAPGVRVPPSAVRDGRVVLNIAASAVSKLDLGRESVAFLARFGGVSQSVEIPVSAVLAIYARENGQGMMFPAEEGSDPEPEGNGDVRPAGQRRLHVVR